MTVDHVPGVVTKYFLHWLLALAAALVGGPRVIGWPGTLLVAVLYSAYLVRYSRTTAVSRITWERSGSVVVERLFGAQSAMHVGSRSSLSPRYHQRPRWLVLTDEHNRSCLIDGKFVDVAQLAAKLRAEFDIRADGL